MSSERPEGEDRPTSDRHTLGEVLHAYGTEARAETEWVGLVRSIAAGDQSAMQELYERLHRLVYTLIARITHNRETAEEVTLDVFHDVWRRAATYDPAGGPVVGWVMNQARSRTIDRLRFERRKKRVDDRGDDGPPAVAEPEPHDVLQLRDQAHLLRRALEQLTAREREAIEVAFFGELTYVETATRLNEPIGTVKTRIRSGLEKLRQALERRREP